MIHNVVILQHDEECMPPERILEVEVVEDIVFLEIADYTEGYDHQELKNARTIGVKVYDLLKAITVLNECQD